MLAFPHIAGGVNFFPTTYSLRTHLSYGGELKTCNNITRDPTNDAAGFTGYILAALFGPAPSG
jgi:hypothetical protein